MNRNVIISCAVTGEALGIKPELEVFDSGQLWFVNQMLSEDLLDEPALIQICLGIPWASRSIKSGPGSFSR
jgi:uncharacterized protein (DUF849 family)